MPDLKGIPRRFKAGDPVSATLSNATNDALVRQHTGAAPVTVSKIGNRLVFGAERDYARGYDQEEILLYSVLVESADYLLCAPFHNQATPAQAYSATLGSDVPVPERVYVAKPYLLQRTPWDGKTVTYGGISYTYIYTSNNTRKVVYRVGAHTGVYSEVIDQGYFVGDVIAARPGLTGYETTSVQQVQADQQGGVKFQKVTVPVQWSDINEGARDWDVIPDDFPYDETLVGVTGDLVDWDFPGLTPTDDSLYGSRPEMIVFQPTAQDFTLRSVKATPLADGTYPTIYFALAFGFRFKVSHQDAAGTASYRIITESAATVSISQTFAVGALDVDAFDEFGAFGAPTNYWRLDYDTAVSRWRLTRAGLSPDAGRGWAGRVSVGDQYLGSGTKYCDSIVCLAEGAGQKATPYLSSLVLDPDASAIFRSGMYVLNPDSQINGIDFPLSEAARSFVVSCNAAPGSVATNFSIGGGGLGFMGAFGTTIGSALNYTPITGATNTTPVVISSSAPHGLATGNKVTVINVTGLTGANGTWLVTVLSSTTFSLDGSQAGWEDYTGGGTWSKLSPTSWAMLHQTPGEIGFQAWFSGSQIDAAFCLFDHLGAPQAGVSGAGGGGDIFFGGICVGLGAGPTITVGTTPVSGGTNYGVLTTDGAGKIAETPPAPAGLVITSTGTGSPPAYQSTMMTVLPRSWWGD